MIAISRALVLILLALFAVPAARAGSGPSSAASPVFVAFPADPNKAFAADHLNFTLVSRGKQNVLLAWGQIADGDYARFRTAIEQARPIREIWLFSPGGSLDEGIEIGRLIRSRRLATRIPDHFYCVSACNFVFMGGVVRMVDTEGRFITHMFVFAGLPKLLEAHMEKIRLAAASATPKATAPQAVGDSPQSALAALTGSAPDAKDAEAKIEKQEQAFLDGATRDIEQDAAKEAAEIARYLVEMQLSLKFLTTFAAIPNANARPLTREELREFDIINTD